MLRARTIRPDVYLLRLSVKFQTEVTYNLLRDHTIVLWCAHSLAFEVNVDVDVDVDVNVDVVC